VEIPPKTYDVNSEISYGVKSARNNSPAITDKRRLD